MLPARHVDDDDDDLYLSTCVDQAKGSVLGSMWIPEFDMKHLMKAEGHIGRNFVRITLKMMSIVQIFIVITTRSLREKKKLFI